jgi:hypothetical protein
MNSSDQPNDFRACFTGPKDTFEAYFYVGTLAGIAKFIESSVQEGWPLGSLAQLLSTMQIVVEGILNAPPANPSNDWEHKKYLAEAIRDTLNFLIGNEKPAVEGGRVEKQDLHLFQLGTHWGALAALYGEHMEFLKGAFHSLKSREGIRSRWEYENKIYDSAVNKAIHYWSEGGNDLHDEVAQRLAKKFGVKYGALRRRLVAAARQAGFSHKIRGLPGSKK